jgi:Zn-dependent peptidase ImmA (M78 family)
MKKTQAIKMLSKMAEALGYKVVFRRVKDMCDGDVGLTCPDVSRIYIDPKGEKDKISTLAHEIGHVLLMSCSAIGHRSEGDTNFDLQIAENAADAIGAVLCKAIGLGNDFDDLSTKSNRSFEEAKQKYKTDQEYTAFVFGYCVALADTLISSEIGIKDVIRKADDVFSGRTKYYRSRVNKKRMD